ncbi:MULTISPECIES: DUF3105 domain-containing protein [unclassified Parafrankia]|uniref:DUF3105 domain-containing protein n=1 Tax=Parafrankia TaxID=2994362 RepID=UPI000DA573A3|nr:MULTISPECIES: DUF3105 domain-containing protein [unclassified Parafrankia]TCJ34116.1 DUF3105 domain-containing protein [Parafrankia sp. BMG5.11]CAI7978419.1 DUF3105 domain-containing protein [Frankia sp. Hr75.2]SQD94054.1 conserved hypothetical protein [Parafrankia sp. Ea1.12]
MGKKSVARNARLEELRREQKRKERRRALLIYGTSGFVALALLAGIIVYSVFDNRSKNKERSVGYVAAASPAAVTANCTGIRNDQSYGNQHVGATDTVEYKDSPPSSGNHESDPLPDAIRFYNPDSGIRAERAVHNLEHGFVVGWYDAKLPADQVEKLRTVAADAGNRFIAMPWTRNDFAGDQHFVLTGWDRTQRCGTVSADVVKEFVQKWANPPLDGVTWDSPTAAESGAAGGTLNVTEDGPIDPAAAAAGGVVPGAGTMTQAPTAP